MPCSRIFTLVGLVLLLTVGVVQPPAAAAQYFGKNKVQYEDFDWQVIETEHFDIYYYEGESESAFRAARRKFGHNSSSTRTMASGRMRRRARFTAKEKSSGK